MEKVKPEQSQGKRKFILDKDGYWRVEPRFVFHLCKNINKSILRRKCKTCNVDKLGAV